MNDRVSRPPAEVILIAPRQQLVATMLHKSITRIRCFTSTEDFDAWRNGHQDGACLERLVDELEARYRAEDRPVPVRLQMTISWLRRQPSVPTLKALATATCSRRSFFRLWSQAMREQPARFLDHLRALRAEQMLASGFTLQEILRDSGCKSMRDLRLLLSRWH